MFDGSGSVRTLDGLFRRVRCWTGRAGCSTTAEAAPEGAFTPTDDDSPLAPGEKSEPERAATLGAISS